MHAQAAVSLQFEAFRDTFHPSDWRVEAINSTSGDVFVAIFCGPLTQERATEYADFMNDTRN
jgi:hypothetical protein